MTDSRRAFWWTLIGIFLFLGLLIYGASLTNTFVRWDDGLLIYENSSIRSFSFTNLKTIFTSYDPELYIPLTLLSYQFDFLISGTSAAWYHLHSLVLHIFNAILIVWVLKLLTKNTWVSVLTGLLFLIHPLHTEAVAWASGRKDLLSTMLALISVGLYLLPSRKMYLLSIGAFFLALLAKVTVLTLPAVLILIVLIQQKKLEKEFWKKLVPYIGLSAVFAVIAYFGKTGVIDSSTTMEKLLIAPMSTAFYLQKLLAPTGLSVLYPLVGDISLFPIFICSTLLIIGLWSIRKLPVVFFSLAFFAITLSPSLLNFSKGDYLYFASDRYAYIPSIGIFFLLSTGMYALWKRSKALSGGILIVALSMLCTLSAKQSLVWANSETLFTNAIAHYPASHTAHNNLGNIYRTRNEIPQSVDSYTEALRLSKEYGRGDAARISQSKILSNLASSYRVQGDSTLALKSLVQAVELNPKNVHVFLQRGIVYGVQGKYTEAETAYLHAIDLKPNFTTAKVNLGSLYINLARAEEAVTLLEGAVEENPYYPQAFYNLAAAYKKVGRNRESLEAYEKAVEIQPAFVAARINLGILYAERQKINLAIEQFKEVLKYDPSNSRAISALRQLGAL